MNRAATIPSVILLMLFMFGCISNSPDRQSNHSQENGNFSVAALQDYDSSLCGSTGTIKGGYEHVGLRLQAYDSESGEIIKIEREYFEIGRAHV